MRIFVLALMITLLPLRSWVGDAMAGQMLQQQMAAINLEASYIDSTRGSNGFDASTAGQSVQRMATLSSMQASAPHGVECEGHRGATAPQAMAHTIDPADMAASDCATCPSCQVCHGFVLVMPLPTTALTAHQQAAPTVHGEKFASAEAVRGFKPPIS